MKKIEAYKVIEYSNRKIADLIGRYPQTINNAINTGSVLQVRKQKQNGKIYTYEKKDYFADVYFCHPFASFERGTSENQHKIIRRFLPIHQSLKDIEDSHVRRAQQWMNDYPRKILGYQMPRQAYVRELKKIDLELVA